MKTTQGETLMREKYEYAYQVDDNSVDINALLVSQLHFSTVVNEIAKRLNPEIEISIRVVAPKEGSFIFQQWIEIMVSNNLLNTENANYAAEVFKVVGEIISLKKWLGGQKAEKIEHTGDDVRISFNGDVQNVTFNTFNLYTTDKVINSAVEKAFEAIETDESIDGLIIRNSEPISEVSKNEFESLTTSNSYLDSDTQEEIKPSVKLFIKNPDLVPKNPKNVVWNFLWEGVTKIKARIRDDKFLKEISSTNIRVGAYDSIVADLKVISKFNEQAQVFLPDSFEVIKVHKVVYRQQPGQSRIEGNGF